MTRRIVTSLITLIVLLILSIITTPVVLADGPLFLPAPAPAAPELWAEREQEHSIPPAAPVSHSICDEHFWTVNIRHCENGSLTCGDCCGFRYSRSDWCGRSYGSDEQDFQSSLTPGVPICIMVHGSFVPEDTVPQDSIGTFRWLRRAAPHLPLHVVFLSWPSDGVLTLNGAIASSSLVPGLDVAILGRRAEINGFRLANLVRSLPPESPVCLIGHSHGARMVASATHLLGGGSLRGEQLCETQERSVRVVLAAAAIDHDWLSPGQRYDRTLNGADCVLNLKSRLDWALCLYPLRRVFSRRALGHSGFTNTDLRRLGPRAAQVCELDVTGIVKLGHIWPRYYERPELAAMLLPWMYFNDSEYAH